MKLNYEERSEKLGKFLIENHSTVRETGKYFGISKSTVHKDLVKKLPHINFALYVEVEKILQLNKEERHLRGGEATKQKYLHKKESRINQ